MRAAIVGMRSRTAIGRRATCRSGTRAATTSGDLLAAAQRARRSSTAHAALDRLRPLLEDAAVRKVGHDLKFDMIVLARHGITLRGVEFDSMLASYLLDATRSSQPSRRPRSSTSATGR